MVSFPELFMGSDQSHGYWSADIGGWTAESPATPADYEDHLTGVRGLGIVPVRADGTCAFGALDIDVDTIDHRSLWVKVQHRGLPLSVCRSKSGGAHLYAFFNPPLPAPEVRKLLRGWSGLLGYPKCEVFPKQDKISAKNLGSWINLPYFGGDQTTRYCMGPEGPLGLQDFLLHAQPYDPSRPINRELPQLGESEIADMPPCLEALTRNGLPSGARNQGLLNFGVYYRKAFPNDWEARVRDHNTKHVSPPLEGKELEGVIASLNRRNYAYVCAQEPIASRCDREACLKRTYGINHRFSMEHGFYDDLEMCNLRKFNSVPPRYRVELVGRGDLELASEELRNYATGFKGVVFDTFNMLLRPMKQDQWDKQLRDLLQTIKIIEVPFDASQQGVVMMKVKEFLALAERARAREDVLKGLPFRENGRTIFRLPDLQKYLQTAKLTVETQKLYTLLESHGASYEDTKVKGKRTVLWLLPEKDGDRQTEGFTPPAAETQEGSSPELI